MVAMDFFEASNFYDFFNQYCLNLLKNPTVRGLSQIEMLWFISFYICNHSVPTPEFLKLLIVCLCLAL